jgi:hypothetical protein
MTIVTQDSVDLLSPDAGMQYSQCSLEAVLYVDDTLLMSANSSSLQELLDKVAAVGARYGMELH